MGLLVVAANNQYLIINNYHKIWHPDSEKLENLEDQYSVEEEE